MKTLEIARQQMHLRNLKALVWVITPENWEPFEGLMAEEAVNFLRQTFIREGTPDWYERPRLLRAYDEYERMGVDRPKKEEPAVSAEDARREAEIRRRDPREWTPEERRFLFNLRRKQIAG